MLLTTPGGSPILPSPRCRHFAQPITTAGPARHDRLDPLRAQRVRRQGVRHANSDNAQAGCQPDTLLFATPRRDPAPRLTGLCNLPSTENHLPARTKSLQQPRTIEWWFLSPPPIARRDTHSGRMARDVLHSLCRKPASDDIIHHRHANRPYPVTDITPNQPAPQKKKQSPFMDLIVSIIVPSVILMKFSGEDNLGPTGALLVALSFPILWGLYDLAKNGVKNYVAILGVVSVLLTGSIGLLKLDAQWLAVKEAAIPLCIGLGVLIANFLGFPLIRKLLYNPSIMRTDRVDEALKARGNQQQFQKRLDRANLFFAGTFFFSAIANYVLAKLIVTSDSGTEAFNNELGRMTLLSYPVIAIPSIIMMLAIFYYVWRTISKLTDLTLEQVIAGAEES